MQASRKTGLHFFSGVEMANPWFRMYSEFAHDPKVQMLSEADQRRYVMILCLRCSNDHVTLQDEEVAFHLRISNEEWLRTKATLMAKDLIDDGNSPTKWDKRQFASDSSAERVARHRAAKKQAAKPCNVTVTPPEAEADTDTEADTELKARAGEASTAVATTTNETARAETPTTSSAGEACKALRAAGVQAVNPSHPKLIALLEAGLTADELGELAREPQASGKGFAWILAAAEGRRRDAAKIRPLPRASPSLADRNRQATEGAKKMIFGG